jgi:hypothetical protein
MTRAASFASFLFVPSMLGYFLLRRRYLSRAKEQLENELAHKHQRYFRRHYVAAIVMCCFFLFAFHLERNHYTKHLLEYMGLLKEAEAEKRAGTKPAPGACCINAPLGALTDGSAAARRSRD